MTALQLSEFIEWQKKGAELLDTRDVEAFKAGFIPSSINIPANKLAEWAGEILKKDEPLVLVIEAGKAEEPVEILKKLGFGNIAGFLSGGFEAWQEAQNPIDMIIDVEADELMMDIPFDENLLVVDVRKPMEYAEGHLKDALSLPLSEITDPVKIAQFEESDNLYLHCAGGTRSVIAASVLKKHGIHNLRNIVGGWGKIKEEPKTEIVKEPNVLN